MKKIVSIVLSAIMVVQLVAFSSSSASAATFYTMPLNSQLLKGVGAQSHDGVACACFALAYCRTILDGETHYWYEYNHKESDEKSALCNWKKGNYTKARAKNSLEVLKKCYEAVNNNRPMIIHVTSKQGGHYVTVVGCQNVSDVNKMTYDNLLILDPWYGYGKGPRVNNYKIHSDRVYVYANETSIR